MREPWYCTREDVMAASDIKLAAWMSRRIDRAIGAAARQIDRTCHRTFYPWTGTRTFDWPNPGSGTPWRLWLDRNELISATTLTSGGTGLVAGHYFLRPDDGPPYNRIEINLDSTSAFDSGDTHQRAVSLAGVWGYTADTEPAGTLTAAVSTASATTMTVTDSSTIGVGDLVLVDTERMIVTDKRLSSTGQTLQSPLEAQQNAVSVAVTNGAAFTPGEVLLLDSERVLVVDVAGNTLAVQRSHDGSVLAAHTGSTIYATRTLVVERGSVGTTAANSHADGAAIARHTPPGLVRDLNIAEALNTLYQETSGYSRQIGSGEGARESFGRGLKDLRAEVYATYGRKARTRAV